MSNEVDKGTAIKIIASMLKRRLKSKGQDVSSFSEKWFLDKAEEVYSKQQEFMDGVADAVKKGIKQIGLKREPGYRPYEK